RATARARRATAAALRQPRTPPADEQRSRGQPSAVTANRLGRAAIESCDLEVSRNERAAVHALDLHRTGRLRWIGIAADVECHGRRRLTRRTRRLLCRANTRPEKTNDEDS